MNVYYKKIIFFSIIGSVLVMYNMIILTAHKESVNNQLIILFNSKKDNVSELQAFIKKNPTFDWDNNLLWGEDCPVTPAMLAIENNAINSLTYLINNKLVTKKAFTAMYSLNHGCGFVSIADCAQRLSYQYPEINRFILEQYAKFDLDPKNYFLKVDAATQELLLILQNDDVTNLKAFISKYPHYDYVSFRNSGYDAPTTVLIDCIMHNAFKCLNYLLTKQIITKASLMEKNNAGIYSSAGDAAAFYKGRKAAEIVLWSYNNFGLNPGKDFFNIKEGTDLNKLYQNIIDAGSILNEYSVKFSGKLGKGGNNLAFDIAVPSRAVYYFNADGSHGQNKLSKSIQKGMVHSFKNQGIYLSVIACDSKKNILSASEIASGKQPSYLALYVFDVQTGKALSKYPQYVKRFEDITFKEYWGLNHYADKISYLTYPYLLKIVWPQ